MLYSVVDKLSQRVKLQSERKVAVREKSCSQREKLQADSGVD